eukprot:TRINITY_DN8886_c0_g1_i1.p2 TRINITY_DN8886_c0_g1~~TRINITY_DN8886_c0_g1_i1.p2  ORF type:complete len:268 (+),score=89.04 TRINITY_DN8886_c0_g1_i1:28-804(+)
MSEGGGGGGGSPDDLELFGLQCLKVGCLRGFRYFRCHLRGREELVVTVVDADGRAQGAASPTLPRRVLTVVEGGQPPASPCDTSGSLDITGDPYEVTFLIATYARYGRPMVWLRNPLGHVDFRREVVAGWKADPTAKPQHDAELPLKLFTIEAWPQDPRSVPVWDVIAELVAITVRKPPANPLALDWEDGVLGVLPRLTGPGGAPHAAALDLVQLLFASAALMAQLQFMATTPETRTDLGRLAEAHFRLLQVYLEQRA